MAFFQRTVDRKRASNEYRRQEEEVIDSLCRLSSRPGSPKSMMEQEKRIRREIANSNERRRMQSINAGFQSLRNLLPHRGGEKLSKAAILQSTADYVYRLENEKSRLVALTSQLNRGPHLSPPLHNQDSDSMDSPLPKRRRKKDSGADSMDEGIGNSSPCRSDNGMDDASKRELVELRHQLEQERTLRVLLQQHLRTVDPHYYISNTKLDIDSYISNTKLDTDSLQFQYSNENEVFNKIARINAGMESGLGSPQSQVSSQDIESTRESSPEPLSSELPEDLSGHNKLDKFPGRNLLNELVLSDVHPYIPTTGLLQICPPEGPPPLNINSGLQQVAHNIRSTSRQNLDTIVEAIRHVEGDHMFRDDITPTKAQDLISEKHVELSNLDQISFPLHSQNEFLFQHQIIMNAPLIQPRPGVIVPNLS